MRACVICKSVIEWMVFENGGLCRRMELMGAKDGLIIDGLIMGQIN